MKWFVLIALAVFAFVLILRAFKRSYIRRLFSSSSCAVVGMKGTGKDLLFCLVVNLRKRNYISNVLYSNPKKRYQCFPFVPVQYASQKLSTRAVVEGVPQASPYPYPDGLDVYISDSGVYFPSTEDSFLKKAYPAFPIYEALSRHCADFNFHFNCQTYSRVWLIIREQCDRFVRTFSSRVFFGRICRIKFRVYEQADSADLGRVPPMFGKRRKDFFLQYGKVKSMTYWFWLPYKYDSRGLKKLINSADFCYEGECHEIC